MSSIQADPDRPDSSSGGGGNLSFIKSLGPGLITGAADDDPSGIATYSQVGAQFGFAITWTMLFSYPLMTAIQEISARIGRTTGHGLAGNLRRHYPGWILPGIVALLAPATRARIHRVFTELHRELLEREAYSDPDELRAEREDVARCVSLLRPPAAKGAV